MYSIAPAERLILASISPRRRELLSACGLKFDIRPSQVEEDLLANEHPKDVVTRLSLAKASEIAAQEERSWILGADTVVVSPDGEILGKPKDREDAIRMLNTLQGHAHEVHGSFAIVSRERKVEIVRHCVTEVEFAPLARSQIERYVATDEPLDKAGSYAAQGLGAAFITRVSGSYTNVIGLPLAEVLESLLKLKIIH